MKLEEVETPKRGSRTVYEGIYKIKRMIKRAVARSLNADTRINPYVRAPCSIPASVTEINRTRSTEQDQSIFFVGELEEVGRSAIFSNGRRW
jgi:hypothetical protein